MSKVHEKESFQGIGSVTIRPFKMREDGTKEYLPTFNKNNLIVQLGRASLVDLLIGAKKKKLAFIRWGKGGALSYPDGDPLNPLPVSDTDSDVASFLLDKPLSPYTRISPTEVQYLETVICDEIDSDVNEAAMFFEEEVSLARSIFARITFPTVRLTIDQGTGIEIKWIFNFTKAEELPVEFIEEPVETEPADTTAPDEVSNLAETHTDTSATLTWTNPTNQDFAYTNIYKDGVLIVEQLHATTWSDSGLTSSTPYTYTIKTVDMVGNESLGMSITVTTNATV